MPSICTTAGNEDAVELLRERAGVEVEEPKESSSRNDVIRPLHNEVVLAATLDSSPNWQAIDTISIRDSRVPKENKSPDNYDPSKMFPPEIGPRRHGDENITSLDWRYNVMKVIEQEGLERLLPPE